MAMLPISTVSTRAVFIDVGDTPRWYLNRQDRGAYDALSTGTTKAPWRNNNHYLTLASEPGSFVPGSGKQGSGQLAG
jgi:hypothetical protein